ncbi:MAG: type II toxin-antitoxin system VapC family toxin [Pseudonocardiaceae bacterium]
MGTVVLDASALIGLVDPADAHHRAAVETARELRAAGMSFLVPTTVLAEILVAPAGRGLPAVQERCRIVRAAFGPTRAIDEEVAVEAAGLRSRHRSLRLPDALVLAVGRVDCAAVVLTADRRWTDVDERVHVLL